MAVNIIIRLFIAWFGIGVLMYVMMPTIHEVAYNLPVWNTMPANLLAIRDNLYGVFLICGIIAFAVSILWGFSSATRAESATYESDI